MTRINVGVEPKELPDRLLMAEHREIKRIPNCIKNGRFNLSKIPERFTLGTGHVSFFYNKILYLKKRYQKIYQECLERGFNVTNFSESFENIDEYFMNDYQETPRDRELLFQRFSEKGFDV
jgi:hypothetical protein